MDSARVKQVLITKSFGVTIGAKLSFLINIKKKPAEEWENFFSQVNVLTAFFRLPNPNNDVV